MDDIRELLEEAVGEFTPGGEGPDGVADRARRRRARSRLTAAAVATVVATAGIALAVWTFSSGSPVASPSHAPTGNPSAAPTDTRGTGPAHSVVAPPCVSGWASFDVPAPGNLQNVLAGVDALSDTDAWAVGWSTQVPPAWLSPRPPGSHGPAPPELVVPVALHWDGSAWNAVHVPNADVFRPGSDAPQGGVRLMAVAAVAPDDAWAVGGGQGPVIEHWDGTTWSIVSSPDVNLVDEELVGVAASGPDDVWAIGSGGDNGDIGPVIEHWDGSGWSVTPTPPVNTRYSELNGISALSPDDAWAVGQEWNRPLALHWNGASWTKASVPNIRAIRLGGVVQLAPDDAWAAGTDYANLNGTDPASAVLAHWDGSSWSLVPTPLAADPDSTLHDISAAGPDDIWARGSVAPADHDVGTPALLHFDGSSWNVVPSPTNPPQTDSWSGIGAAPGGSVWLAGSTMGLGGSYAENPFLGRSCSG